ncbi:ankyrin repeat protein, partial [Lindgomyces ingoldianus]
GNSALHIAASRASLGVTRIIIQAGADLNALNHKGKPPLSLAAENGQEAVVSLLLTRNGVDRDSKDNAGRTPLSLAAENGQEGVVKLLLVKNGIDPDSK